MKYHDFLLLCFITYWFDSINALAINNDDIQQAKED